MHIVVLVVLVTLTSATRAIIDIHLGINEKTSSDARLVPEWKDVKPHQMAEVSEFPFFMLVKLEQFLVIGKGVEKYS